MAALDNTLYYLGRNSANAMFDFVMMHPGANKGDKAVLLFQEGAFVEAHVGYLPEEITVQTLDDERAKEEFLRAALRQGATQVWFDVDEERLEPKSIQPLAEALFYILSFRREAACL